MADTRMIRKALLDSERVNGLDWFAQVFYFRLLLVADDFGLYDGRVAFMRAQMYGMCLDRVREADLQRALRDCERAGLIRFYEAGGKPYVMVLRYGQRCRKAPKYPLPPHFQVVKRGHEYELVEDDSDNLQQAAANCGELQQKAAYAESESESETEANNKTTHTLPREGAGGVQALPRSVDEVLACMGNMPHCGLQGAEAEECARKFFDSGEECGWLTKNGLPVNNWHASLRKWVQSWQLHTRYQTTSRENRKNNYSLDIT